eukprot:2603560-Pleurochrysis_carterae.AAC.1
MRTLLKPEPISIPTPARPKIDIPLAAATSPLDAACSGLVHLPEPAGAPSQPADAVSAKDAARQRDLERLNEVLSHSEIQPEQLQLLEVLGAGSSGVVQKVLHVPSDSVLALKVGRSHGDVSASLRESECVRALTLSFGAGGCYAETAGERASVSRSVTERRARSAPRSHLINAAIACTCVRAFGKRQLGER